MKKREKMERRKLSMSHHNAYWLPFEKNLCVLQKYNEKRKIPYQLLPFGLAKIMTSDIELRILKGEAPCVTFLYEEIIFAFE